MAQHRPNRISPIVESRFPAVRFFYAPVNVVVILFCWGVESSPVISHKQKKNRLIILGVLGEHGTTLPAHFRNRTKSTPPWSQFELVTKGGSSKRTNVQWAPSLCPVSSPPNDNARVLLSSSGPHVAPLHARHAAPSPLTVSFDLFMHRLRYLIPSSVFTASHSTPMSSYSRSSFQKTRGGGGGGHINRISEMTFVWISFLWAIQNVSRPIQQKKSRKLAFFLLTSMGRFLVTLKSRFSCRLSILFRRPTTSQTMYTIALFRLSFCVFFVPNIFSSSAPSKVILRPNGNQFSADVALPVPPPPAFNDPTEARPSDVRIRLLSPSFTCDTSLFFFYFLQSTFPPLYF